ncbi:MULTISPECIES: hypothetical protein, partial [Aeromonas]|uniref:hypothetical protein n=1 Tax=Aeromonas TaxID=642 RepID=UPI001C88C9A0
SHAFPGVGFCLGEGQEIDWIGHTEYSETRIEQLDHIFNLIGMTAAAGKTWCLFLLFGGGASGFFMPAAHQ